MDLLKGFGLPLRIRGRGPAKVVPGLLVLLPSEASVAALLLFKPGASSIMG